MVQVLVKDCLTPEKLERVRAAAAHTIKEMVALDPLRVGNRGSHRYCFANAFNHFGHMAEWALLIDPPPVLAVLEVSLSLFLSLSLSLSLSPSPSPSPSRALWLTG